MDASRSMRVSDPNGTKPALAELLSVALAERRGQLRAVAEAHGPPSQAGEARHICDRLRSILGLRA